MSYSDIRTYDFAGRLALFGHSSSPSSASSAMRGETAGRTEFTSDESREPLDDSSSPSLGGLHDYIRH